MRTVSTMYKSYVAQALTLSPPPGFIHFKPNTYGRWGSIIAFHCYSGQDEKRHSHYDSNEGTDPIPKQMDTFNNIIGARDAIEKSASFIKYFAAQTKWEDGVKQFLEQEVFALAPNAKPSDNNVDGSLGPCSMVGSKHSMSDIHHQNFDYAAGLQRKMALLDNDRRNMDPENQPVSPLWAKRGGQRSFKGIALRTLLGFLVLAGLIVSSALVSRVMAKVLS